MLADPEKVPLLGTDFYNSGARTHTSRLRQLFASHEYEVVILAVVLLNAASIGYQIDFPAALPLYGWLLLNLAFFGVFLLEVVLKIAAFGWREYFQSYWNSFDFSITVLCCVEIFLTYAHFMHHTALHGTLTTYVSGDFVAMMRLFRLARLGRIFPQLRVLARSFLYSVQALGWIVAAAMLWFYLCACFCTVFLGRRDFMPAAGDEDVQEVRARFSTVGKSLYALFEVMTLEGWTDYARPLLHKSPQWVVFFIVFIFVSAFFLLNLVTAVVVERTVQSQEAEKQAFAETGRDRRVSGVQAYVAALRKRNGGRDEVNRAELGQWADECRADVSLSGILPGREQTGVFLESLAMLIDHEDDGVITLSALEDLWSSIEEPLSTQHLLRFNIEQAQRTEYQERLLVTVLHALAATSGQKLKIREGILDKNVSFLEEAEV